MIQTIIKYFAIIWCSIYTCSKLVNKPSNYKQKILWIPIAIFSSIISYFFRLYLSPVNIIFTYISILILAFFSYRKSINLTTILSLISLSIGVVSYVISYLIAIPLSFILYSLIDNNDILSCLYNISLGCIQIILVFLFFKIKRFRNGLIAHEKTLSNDSLGISISTIILFLTSIIYIKESDQYIDIISIFSLVIVGIFLYAWYKKHLSLVYIEQTYQRNLKIYVDDLFEQKEINTELVKHNEALSKIIHRDNKLIPAMEMAVEEILNCQSPDEQKKKAKDLLPQLKAMSAERVGIVTEYETINKKLPSTGIFSLDSSLKYLIKKANDKNITFDLSVTAEINNITNSIIPEDDLNTLILDLGENAIIATSDMEHRNVLVVMGYEDNNFCISIYDSGSHFDPKVISKLGIKRITTHKNTGGSGIGMMTTFELLQKYQASFILDETINSDKFTKKVSIHFDRKNEYRIQTHRTEVINIAKKRTDLIIN